MNTTAAAAEANVTVATVRTWCRYGAVEAAKVAGRWVIETASLARRIAIGARRAPAPKKVVYSVETMTAIGGNEWERYGKHRVYFDAPVETFAGLELAYYKSGNICGAWLGDEKVSNAEGGRLAGAVAKLYFDAADGKLHIQWGYGEPRSLTRAELADRIFAGVRAAIAAL